jgi:hypothetical protein
MTTSAGATSGAAPPPPPPRIGLYERHVSRKTNAVYYFNPSTRESVWADEERLPAGWGWSRAADTRPKVYVNLLTGERTEEGAPAPTEPAAAAAAAAPSAAAAAAPPAPLLEQQLSFQASRTAGDDLLSTPYIPDETTPGVRGRNVPDKVASKRDYLFAALVPPSELWRVQVDEVALYSVTEGRQAERMTATLAALVGPDAVVTDATGCVGGNALSFAKAFRFVYAVELSAQRARMLAHNAGVAGVGGRVRVVCGDSTRALRVLRQDVVFFDPPWGGPEYKDAATLDMFLGPHDVADLVVELTGGRSAQQQPAASSSSSSSSSQQQQPPADALARVVAVKAPVNYNVAGLKRKLEAAGRGAVVFQELPFHKMLLLLVRPGPGVRFPPVGPVPAGDGRVHTLVEEKEDAAAAAAAAPASRKRGSEALADADGDEGAGGEVTAPAGGHHGAGGAAKRAAPSGAGAGTGAGAGSASSSAGGAAASAASSSSAAGTASSSSSSSPSSSSLATSTSAVAALEVTTSSSSTLYLHVDPKAGTVFLAPEPEYFTLALAPLASSASASSSSSSSASLSSPPARISIASSAASAGAPLLFRASRSDPTRLTVRAATPQAPGPDDVELFALEPWTASAGTSASPSAAAAGAWGGGPGSVLLRAGTGRVLGVRADPRGGPPLVVQSEGFATAAAAATTADVLRVRPVFRDSIRSLLCPLVEGGGEQPASSSSSSSSAGLVAALLSLPLPLAVHGKAGEGKRGVAYRVSAASGPLASRSLVLKVQPHDDRVREEVAVVDAVERGRGSSGTGAAAADTKMTPPALVRCYGVFRDASSCYLLLDDVGAPAEDLLVPSPAGVAGSPSSAVTALAVWRRLLAALAELHGAGFLHCDVHAGNVLLPSADRAASAALIDFGSARKITAASGTYQGPTRGGRWDIQAPEQFGPEKWGTGPVTLSPSADLFAAAAVFVHLASGSAPFAPEPPGSKLSLGGCRDHRLRRAAPAALQALVRAALPPELAGAAEVCAKCLRPAPGERYGTAQEVLEALRGIGGE